MNEHLQERADERQTIVRYLNELARKSHDPAASVLRATALLISACKPMSPRTEEAGASLLDTTGPGCAKAWQQSQEAAGLLRDLAGQVADPGVSSELGEMADRILELFP